MDDQKKKVDNAWGKNEEGLGEQKELNEAELAEVAGGNREELRRSRHYDIHLM